MTYVFDFDKIYVDGEEFVVVFKSSDEDVRDCCPTEDIHTVELDTDTSKVVTELYETPTVEVKEIEENIIADSDVDETEYITNEDVFELIKQWFEDERVLENFYESESVFATNARQVIVLPQGRTLTQRVKVYKNLNDVISYIDLVNN